MLQDHYSAGVLMQDISCLGSIPAYVLASYPDLIRAELKIPDDLSIIIGIALGYSDAQHPQNKFRSPRRPIQEAVRFKGF